jgi:hypothetical protein
VARARVRETGQGQGQIRVICASKRVLFQPSLKRRTFHVVRKQQIRDGVNILGDTCLLTCSLANI